MLFGKKEIYKRSYSQTGEDMIVDFLFDMYGIRNPGYLDIGAHDPYYFSNTAYFYKNGCRGINIEPNPVLFNNIAKARKGDINLNIGVGPENGELEFYVMNVPTMSTFSKDQADELVRDHGFLIDKELKVEVCTIQSILDKYNGGRFPEFLSLDIEGMDLEVLKTIDFSKTYPKIICVETVEYGDLEGKKDEAILSLLRDNGYHVVADTFINTIFSRID